MRRIYRNRYRKMHPEKNKKYLRDYYQRIRMKSLTYYGGNPPKCACCGETEIKFLTIDHIKGGANAMRKKDSSHKSLYFWLRKHNYPSGYQVLCYNCNCGRAHNNGICPHQITWLDFT